MERLNSPWQGQGLWPLTLHLNPAPSEVTDPRRTSGVAHMTRDRLALSSSRSACDWSEEPLNQLTKLRLIKYLIELESAAKKAPASSNWRQLP